MIEFMLAIMFFVGFAFLCFCLLRGLFVFLIIIGESEILIRYFLDVMAAFMAIPVSYKVTCLTS